MNEHEIRPSGDGRAMSGYSSLHITGEEPSPLIDRGLQERVVQITEESEGIGMYETEQRHEIEISPSTKIIIKNIDEAVKLINEFLEVYDFEMERMNVFSLFEDCVKLLWENREELNENFKDVLVHLMVAAKNSHYQKYNKNQYKSLKLVLERIKNINISKMQVKECLKLLKDNKIDLFAPIRNWQNYKIEISKCD